MTKFSDNKNVSQGYSGFKHVTTLQVTRNERFTHSRLPTHYSPYKERQETESSRALECGTQSYECFRD